jgi:hypothetical protein
MAGSTIGHAALWSAHDRACHRQFAFIVSLRSSSVSVASTV